MLNVVFLDQWEGAGNCGKLSSETDRRLEGRDWFNLLYFPPFRCLCGHTRPIKISKWDLHKTKCRVHNLLCCSELFTISNVPWKFEKRNGKQARYPGLKKRLEEKKETVGNGRP